MEKAGAYTAAAASGPDAVGSVADAVAAIAAPDADAVADADADGGWS